MSLFDSSHFSGLGGFGGWMGGGFGIPISTVADSRMVPATPEQKARSLDPTERPWTGIISLPGYYPGFDKAPPPSISLYWQMRRYSTIVLAQAITVGPVLAGARTIEIANDKGDKALAGEMQDLATSQVLPFIEQAMAPGFEALHFGFWLQEVIWDRKDGYTIPIEARSFLPGEATIMRDPCRRFVGYQVGSHYRDARYALLTVNNPHIDPIFGESRNEYCREEWWRARQSEENADKTERKAAGMQMGLGVPQGATFLDDRGNAIFPREMAENLVNAAVRGDCFTYPLTAFSKQDCIRNPALMDIPAVKVTQYDWGNNGPALTAHLSRISAIDRKIMMARMRPSREAMEGTSGTRAEAGVHGQIGVTDSELVAAQQLSQITTQVLDRWAVTNFGAKAAGMLVAKQAPLSDPQQQFLQDVYKALCSGQKPDPETVAQIDRRALGKRVEMPLLDQKTVQATLAMQQGGAEPLSTVSSGQRDEEPPSQSPALAAADTTVLALAGELTGGRWVTIKGRHVYIKDGVVAAGARHLLGKTYAQMQQRGKVPQEADGDAWYDVAVEDAPVETADETHTGENPFNAAAKASAARGLDRVSDTGLRRAPQIGEPEQAIMEGRPLREIMERHDRVFHTVQVPPAPPGTHWEKQESSIFGRDETDVWIKPTLVDDETGQIVPTDDFGRILETRPLTKNGDEEVRKKLPPEWKAYFDEYDHWVSIYGKSPSSLDGFRMTHPTPQTAGAGSGARNPPLVTTGSPSPTGPNDDTGWKVGDSINNRTAAGKVPSWNTVRARHWKNEVFNNPLNYSQTNLARMQQGLAPQRINRNTGEVESMELHHTPPQRDGGLFDVEAVWPDEHAAIDPYRKTGN